MRYKTLVYTLTPRSLCTHTMEFRKFNSSKWNTPLRDVIRKVKRIKWNAFYSGRIFAFVKCAFSSCLLFHILPSFWKSLKIKKIQFFSNTDGNESIVECYSLPGRRKYFSFNILDNSHSSKDPLKFLLIFQVHLNVSSPIRKPSLSNTTSHKLRLVNLFFLCVCHLSESDLR